MRNILIILFSIVLLSAAVKPDTKIDRFDMLAEGDTLYGMIKIRIKIAATQYRWALVKLPKSWYTEPAKKYVTLFDWHGSGEIGSTEADLAKLTIQGLPYLIRNNQIPDSFRNPRTNQYKEILMIFIQHSVSGYPLAQQYMVYARDNTDFFKDRIDQDNVFYSGLSLGARGSSGFFVDGWESDLARIRGFVLMSSPAPTGTTTLTQPGGIVEQKKPVYLLWNLADAQSNTIQPWNKKVRDTLNKYNARQVTAYNYISSPAHGGWIARWNPNERRTVTFMDGISMNVNLFEWMLYYSSDDLPTANAGSDKTITLPTNFTTLYGTTIGTSLEWSQISGPAAAFINSPLNDTTTVSSLVEGIYVFRLRSYNGSNYADDYVTVSVNPEPVIPPDPTYPNQVAIKQKGHKWVVIGGTYTPPTPAPEDTIVAQFFFTRNAAVQTYWVNVAGHPHSGVRTGTDTRNYKPVGVSSIATSRWTAASGNSATDNAGESTPNPSYYFPATVTLGYWFTSSTVQTNPMIEISNLEQGSVKYKIEIGASRDDAAVSQSERNCYYICTDQFGNETSANLNVKGNTNRVITFTNKEADSNGKIYLIINPTNLDGSTFGYLGAIRVTKLKP